MNADKTNLGRFVFQLVRKSVGNWKASALGLIEEAVELSAGGIEGSLLVFPAVVDERPAVPRIALRTSFSAEIFLRGGSSLTSWMISPPGSHKLSTWDRQSV